MGIGKILLLIVGCLGPIAVFIALPAYYGWRVGRRLQLRRRNG